MTSFKISSVVLCAIVTQYVLSCAGMNTILHADFQSFFSSFRILFDTFHSFTHSLMHEWRKDYLKWTSLFISHLLGWPSLTTIGVIECRLKISCSLRKLYNERKKDNFSVNDCALLKNSWKGNQRTSKKPVVQIINPKEWVKVYTHNWIMHIQWKLPNHELIHVLQVFFFINLTIMKWYLRWSIIADELLCMQKA